ncbi:MAG: hypothetical protein RL095_2846 [Verrucomicrobiota bacterium]|jgi:uroporphyrinogen-III synthase
MRILLTGLPDTNRKALKICASLGAEGIDFPLQELRLIPSAVKLLPAFDWTVFTSPGGARLYLEHLYPLNGVGHVAAVGPATAEALADWTVPVELMPQSEFTAAGLLQALRVRVKPGESLLLPCSRLAAPQLAAGLAAAGIRVTRLDLYEPAHTAAEPLPACDGVCFFSSSAVEAMHQIYGPDCLQDLPCAVIGPSTRESFLAAFGREALMPSSPSAAATVEILQKNLYGRA